MSANSISVIDKELEQLLLDKLCNELDKANAARLAVEKLNETDRDGLTNKILVILQRGTENVSGELHVIVNPL